MRAIKINVQFPKNSELKAQMEQVNKFLERQAKIDFKLDTSSFTKSLGEMNNALQSLKSKLGKFGILDSFVDDNVASKSKKALDDIAVEFQNLSDASEKVKSKTIIDASGITEVNTYKDSLAKTTSETIKNGKVTSQVFEENSKAITNLQAKLQEKLNTASGNGLIDLSVINNLQNKLNSINTDTPENEIRQLELEIKNLGSNDSGIVRLQNAITKHGITVDSLKEKYKDIVPDNELNDAISKIKILENTMETLQSGGSVSKVQLTKVLNDASSGVKSLQSATKNASEEQRLYNKEVVTFGSAFKDIATKVGLFSIAYTSINMLTRSLRDGVSSVIEMDTALANLNKVVDLSSSQMIRMRDSAVSLGEELGRSAIDVANGMAEFGRQYKDLQTITEMTRASIIGANVMDGMNADEVAKGLTTIISSLKLEAKDAMTILDSMNEVQNNYRISADSMLSALSEIGSTAKVSGSSLQELEGYITAMTVATGASGDEIGNSLKSIMSKIYKLGADGLDSDEAAKPEKALKAVGVAIRDAEGNFRSIDGILKDLNVSWRDMSDSQKIATAQAVAGIHQYDKFLALMNNFDMAMESTATAMDSAGSATKENDIYLESIQGRMSSLQATAQGFWLNFINSDMIKGGVSALQDLLETLTWVQDKMGSMGMSVTALSSAFLLFTKNPLSKALNELSSEIVTSGINLKDFKYELMSSFATLKSTGQVTGTASGMFKAFTSSLNTAKLAEIALQIQTVALQAVLSLGLSFAIGAVITLVTSFSDKLFSARKTMDDCSEQAKTLSDSLSSISAGKDLVSEYEKLNEKLKDNSLSADEIKSLNEQIATVKSQLGADDSYCWILNDETKSLEEQLSLMKELRDIKLRDEAKELDKNMMSQTEIGQYASQLESDAEEWKLLTDAIANADEKGRTMYKGFSESGEVLKKKLAEVEDRIKTNSLEVDKYNGSLNLIKQSGLDTGRSQVELSSAVDSVTNSIKKNTKAKEENGNTNPDNDTSNQQAQVSALESTYKSLGYTVKDAADRIKELNELSDEDKGSEMVKDATKAYGEAISKAKDLQSLMDEINENGLETDTVIELASKYPELGSRIMSVAETQEFLNGKYKEQVDIYNNAVAIMMKDNANWYSQNIANNQSMQDSINGLCQMLTNEQGKAYDIDLKNYATLTELKNAMNQDLIDGLASFLQSLVGGSADTYSRDLRKQMRLYTVMYIENCFNC